jgi:hypothetical protein
MIMVLNQRSALRLLAVALAAVVWCVLPSTAQARKIRVAPTGSTSAIQTVVDVPPPATRSSSVRGRIPARRSA